MGVRRDGFRRHGKEIALFSSYRSVDEGARRRIDRAVAGEVEDADREGGENAVGV